MNAEATMMPMTVRQVAEAVQGRLIVPQTGDGVEDRADALATSAVSDSRQVREGSVFVAIAGERVDGHDFVARAGESGAVVALVQHEVDAPVAQIVVPDTVDALGLLAKANIAARRAVGTPFTLIGITGSVGKTTTKDLMAALLSTLGPTVAPVGSFNNEIGLPLTALKVGRDTRFFVAEMGASHVGEITRLTTIAPPDIAVVLKVGCAHLGEFGSVERIAQAKSEIVQGLVPDGLAVLNVDDAHVAAMAPLAPQGHVFWFGMAGDDAEASAGNAASGKSDALFASDVRTDDGDRPSFTLERADGGTAHVQLAIRGTHNVMNALAAASVAHLLGVPLQSIAETLSRQSRISPHRMAVSTVRRGGMSFTLIDDSFNANPDSMRAGLDGLARWRSGEDPYRIAVLGAMLELGGDESALHEGIGEYAAGLPIDAVIAVGNDDEHFDALASALAKGARKRRDDSDGNTPEVHWVHDIDQADTLVRALAGDHDDTVVLLKGSHASGLSALAQRWTTADGQPSDHE